MLLFFSGGHFRRWRVSSRNFYVSSAAIKAGLFTLAVIGVARKRGPAHFTISPSSRYVFDEPLVRLDPDAYRTAHGLAVRRACSTSFSFVYPGPLVIVATARREVALLEH